MGLERRQSVLLVHAALGRRLGDESIDTLLRQLSASGPYGLRLASEGAELCWVAAIPRLPGLEERRRAALLSDALSAAAGLPAIAPCGGAPATRHPDLPGACRAAAASLGWRSVPAADGAIELLGPGERVSGPVRVVQRGEALVVSCALPLLPLRITDSTIRTAITHAVLRLHAEPILARLRVAGTTPLRVISEIALPAADCDEDEIAAGLAGVRATATLAAPVLRCLSHAPAAAEYVVAHTLRPSGADREENRA
jgi:hypothetical protein